MNKVIVLVALLIASTFTPVQAIKIFGVKIEYKRGKKEWNADRTKTECVGKGMCELTISGDADVKLGKGILGNDENGRFGYEFPVSLIKDQYYAEMFYDGQIHLDGDVEIPVGIRAQIPNCPRVIRHGSYSYEIVGETAVAYF